jgi:hypothetical protein
MMDRAIIIRLSSSVRNGDDMITQELKQQINNLTIALDLEGTLISNAVSQFPRPGLFTFLEYCHENFRLVIFTAVNEVRFRSIEH